MKQLLKRWNTREFFIFSGIIIAVFLLLTGFRDSLSKVTWIVLAIELGLFFVVTYGVAAHTVLKSLFGVSVELSLILFIMDQYCKLPPSAQSADNALQVLVGMGLIYAGVKFFHLVFETALTRYREFREGNGLAWAWMIVVPFAIFAGLFAWQVVQVIAPIVHNSCVYPAS